jgi:hypothetical protein
MAVKTKQQIDPSIGCYYFPDQWPNFLWMKIETCPKGTLIF